MNVTRLFNSFPMVLCIVGCYVGTGNCAIKPQTESVVSGNNGLFNSQKPEKQQIQEISQVTGAHDSNRSKDTLKSTSMSKDTSGSTIDTTQNHCCIFQYKRFVNKRMPFFKNVFDSTSKKSQPTLSYTAGYSSLHHKEILYAYEPFIYQAIKLGYSNQEEAWHNNGSVKYEYRFISGTYALSNQINTGSVIQNNFQSKIWTFGFGRLGGYGYVLPHDIVFIPSYSSNCNFVYLAMRAPNAVAPDSSLLSRYEKQFKFSIGSEAGLNVRYLSHFLGTVGFERSVIYPRFSFWKFVCCKMLEEASQGLLEGFISEIFSSSPQAGPIVYFLLKNGLAYGIYELRQESIYWPFKSDPALTYDKITVGINFIF